MKVNVWQIIIDHLNTLRNARSNRISITDIALFFVVPALGGALGYIEHINAYKDFYNVSITFFGVFVALLLNFQVAAFGIYNRRWGVAKDEKMSLIQTTELNIRRKLLQEINANISYLILVSITSIGIFLILYASEWSSQMASAISWALYIHFMLTLLMVVKRSHILFKREYDET